MNDFKINSKHKIDSGFKIPEDYFENFSEKVLLKISKPEPKVVTLFYKRKTWISSVAAVLVISLSVTLFTKIAVKSTEEKLTLENVSGVILTEIVIPVRKTNEIIGKTALVDIKKGEILNYEKIK